MGLWACSARELRRRVKEVIKDLRQWYAFLVSKYEAWYEMFPTGFIKPPGRKAGAVKPGASPSKIKCYNCHQKLGHRAADCTAAKKESNSGSETEVQDKATAWKCFKCGQKSI